MKTDPQQELFTQLKQIVQELDYPVYDGFLPAEGVQYPFVAFGDFKQTDRAAKGAVFGSVFFAIHVWGDTPESRETVSQMLFSIKTACREIEHTANFAWILRNVNQRVFADAATTPLLLHGILEAEYKFS